jgi:hypothetical protein
MIYLPIMQEIMSDPVILRESGVSYEKANIEAWLATCRFPAGANMSIL